MNQSTTPNPEAGANLPSPRDTAHEPRTTFPKVGVGVLLTDSQGRILLTLRKRPPEANHWSSVGGKLDYFEPLE